MSLIKGEAEKESSSAKQDKAKQSVIKRSKAETELAASAVSKRHSGGDFMKSTVLKPGAVAYQPVPIFDGEHFERPAGFSEGTKENQQGSEVLSVYAVENAEEEARKIKEEAVRFLAKAKEEAERMMSDAQVRAKKLIEQSKLYCETAHANAEREGYKEGVEKGHKAAYEELRQVMNSTQQTLKQVKILHENLAKSMEPGIARLAVKVAEKIIASEVTLSPDLVVSMVRSQLEKVKERDQIVIRVHPHDLDLVRGRRELFTQLLPGVRSLEIQGDARVERGGCMLETNLGTVDACISTQLSAIEMAFSEMAAQEKGGEKQGESRFEALEPAEEEPEDRGRHA